MANAILARFADYTVRRGPNGKLYIAVYRQPHLIYSIDAFLNSTLNIPAEVRALARAAIARVAP